MRSFFLGLYKVLYRYPCKYPLGFPIIVAEGVFLWLFLGRLSPFDWAVVMPLFSVPVFFFVTVLVDVCFWGFLLPRDSFVFPELGVRNRVYLLSFVTASTLFLLMVLVYPLMWELATDLIVLKYFVSSLFWFYVSGFPGVLQNPLGVFGLYQGLNGLVLYSMGFITGCTNVVDRIFWVVSARYFYLLSATEQPGRVRFLRIPLAVTPALYLVGVFWLAVSPPTYVVSAVVYCVLIPVLIFEAIVLGTSATFRLGGKRFRASQFDIIRRLVTLDVLGDTPRAESLGFTDFSEKVSVWTGVIAFKEKGRNVSLIVVPSLHPGPLLSFCGSLLSYRVSESLRSDYGLVMVPHSPSTHDFNPASASEISKVVETVRVSLREEKSDCFEFASPVFVETGAGGCGEAARVFCQAFSDGKNQKVLIFCDLPSRSNGDISYGVGKYLIEAAKDAGAGDAIIIDMHFHPHRNEPPLYMEDSLTEELRGLVERGVRKVLEAEKKRFSLTGAKITRRDLESEYRELAKEIGRDGVTLFVLELEGGGEKYAYVLIDANTIEPDLGRKIVELFRRYGFNGDGVIVMTSDTHQDLLFLRPLGTRSEIHEPLINTLARLLREASKPRRVSACVKRVVSGVNVWGLLNGERFFTLLLRAFPRALAALLIYWLVALLLSILVL